MTANYSDCVRLSAEINRQGYPARGPRGRACRHRTFADGGDAGRRPVARGRPRPTGVRPIRTARAERWSADRPTPRRPRGPGPLVSSFEVMRSPSVDSTALTATGCTARLAVRRGKPERSTQGRQQQEGRRWPVTMRETWFSPHVPASMDEALTLTSFGR